jgi:hypothetical protein
MWPLGISDQLQLFAMDEGGESGLNSGGISIGF